MKSRVRQHLLLIAALLVVLPLACTESPIGSLGGETARNGTDEVRGHVVLSDGGSAENAYVWLQGYNIGTRAGVDGSFTIKLPPPAAQGGDRRVDGIYTIFFYVANYYLRTASVVVRNGEFLYGHGDLLMDGTLVDERRVLTKFLHIQTKVAPIEARNDQLDLLSATVTLSPVRSDDSVAVRFPELLERHTAYLLLVARNSGASVRLSTQRFTINSKGGSQFVKNEPLELTMEFDLRDLRLEPGSYVAVPFVLMEHEPVPEQMLLDLGFFRDEPLDSFLALPYGISAAELLVRSAD